MQALSSWAPASLSFWSSSRELATHGAPRAIHMQTSLALLAVLSGLQLGRHRYARRVNQRSGGGLDREEGG